MCAVNNSLRGGKGAARRRRRGQSSLLHFMLFVWCACEHITNPHHSLFVSLLIYCVLAASECIVCALHIYNMCLHAAALTGSDLCVSLNAPASAAACLARSAAAFASCTKRHLIILSARRLRYISDHSIYFNCFIHFWRVCHKQQFPPAKRFSRVGMAATSKTILWPNRPIVQN